MDGRDLIYLKTRRRQTVRLGGESGFHFHVAALGLKSHALILNHIQIYFLSSEVYASNTPWPLSSSGLNQTRLSKKHFIIVLILSYSWLFVQTIWWRTQDDIPRISIQPYKLSLVLASRGHCCSINFPKIMPFGISCGSLAWCFIEFWYTWTSCYTYKKGIEI